VEVYNRAVMAAICVLAGLTVGAIGLAAVLYRGHSAAHQDLDRATSGGVTRHKLSAATSDAIALRSLELASARKRVKELEKQVGTQAKALSDARRELQNLAAQAQTLRDQRNESLDWLLALLGEDLPPADPTPTAPENGSRETPQSDARQWEQLVEAEDLRNELELSRAALVDAEAARQVERVDLEAAREQIEASAIELLAKIGPEAVTALIEGLDNQDPEIRRLAAKALRGLRENAQPAIPALTMALADPDLRVREEAAMALQVIRD
jgi:HEAT repeat protein